MRLRAALRLGAVCAVVTLSAGCGAGGVRPGTAAPPAAIPSAEAHAATSPVASASAEPGALGGLRSYRYLLAVSVTNVPVAQATASLAPPSAITIDLDGEVNGDRRRTRMRADLGIAVVDNEWVQIGVRAWSRDGAAAWREEPRGGIAAGSAFGLDAAATSLLRSGLDQDGVARSRRVLGGRQPASDRIGGIEALRYMLSARELSDLLGASAGDSPLSSYQGSAQLWVTREGAFPLRLVLDGSGAGDGGQVRLQLDVRDPNSGEIVIEPPGLG